MLLNLEKSPVWRPLPAFKAAPKAISSICEAKSCAKRSETHPYVPTRTKLQDQLDQRKQKQAAHAADFRRQLLSYHPDKDPKITGDPTATLFLARIAYDTQESHIKDEFAAYGRIVAVRLLKGYAFVLFDNAESVANAIQQTSGSTMFRNHRVLLDFERSRRQPKWRPRRLGGGLGGRFSVARQRQDTMRFHQIQRRGAESLRPGNHRVERRPGSYNPRENSYRHDNRHNNNRNDTRAEGLENGPRREDRRTSPFGKGDTPKDRKREAGGRALRQY